VLAATLENGLRVLLQEDHRSPIVSFQMWYRVGSRNEARGANRRLTATLTLPAGQHQYAFVVDGHAGPRSRRPAIDDGFGRRNSVLTL